MPRLTEGHRTRHGSKKGTHMNRALYSGVAGLKAHQTRMDVIGNNISNVNTYGYKSQRAVFSDVFYQTVSSATAGTSTKGGRNPSSIGYGAQLAAIQTKMSQSSTQSTGYGLDTAITGEGFFQVMDSDGNIFYTKAGMLDYDANGYLTDINGNFVLGTTGADSAADSKKIKLDNIGSVPAKQASADMTINGIKYSIKSTNSTEKGNISVSIGASAALASGLKAKASISTTGTISVMLNSNETFSGVADVQSAINAAIKEANGGKELTAGALQITAPDAAAKFTAAGGSLTGAQICGTDFGVTQGTITGGTMYGGAITLNGTSSDFKGNGTVVAGDFKAVYASGTPNSFTVSMTIGSRVYSGVIKEGDSSASILLKNTPDGDYLEVTNPGYSTLFASADTSGNGSIETGEETVSLNTATLAVTPAKESNELGLSSSVFNLTGGTAGGPVTLDQLTSIAIGSDGVITVTQSDLGTVVAGKISLATFANPAGLQLKGTNYYAATGNSGKPILCDPGSNGTGALQSNTLEQSNVDLSSEFADMITTQRGFQANSRIITVSDTMLEELINLKR